MSDQPTSSSPGSRGRPQPLEVAAEQLCLAPDALRARCRRAARRVGDATVANLGGSIVAFKFGRSWRIRFPDP